MFHCYSESRAHYYPIEDITTNAITKHVHNHLASFSLYPKHLGSLEYLFELKIKFKNHLEYVKFLLRNYKKVSLI